MFNMLFSIIYVYLSGCHDPVIRITGRLGRNGPFTSGFPPTKDQGAVSIRKTVLPGMAIPMLKIRRPNGRLIFNMEIAIRR